MYFGKSDPIPLPTVGHLHILKNGYVYWERTSSWAMSLSLVIASLWPDSFLSGQKLFVFL